MTKLFQAIQQAASLLAEGKIVAIPTETVYGLGGCARTPAAIQKIYEIKDRPATNPLIIHLSNMAAIEAWAVDIPEVAWKLAERFWPGPLTLVLKRRPEVLESVTAGQPTVALRVPNHPVTLALLKTFGEGIAAPSANRHGRISPTTAEHVREELGSKVGYILDGGPCQVGIESTIVYVVDSEIHLLRQGSITQQAIEACLECRLPAAPHHASSLKIGTLEIEVPGQSLSHYAPQRPLFLYGYQTLLEKIQQSLAENRPVAVLSFAPLPDFLRAGQSHEMIHWIQANTRAEIYARELYAHLRSLDALNPNAIFVETPPFNSEWLALQDRLYRASQKG